MKAFKVRRTLVIVALAFLAWSAQFPESRAEDAKPSPAPPAFDASRAYGQLAARLADLGRWCDGGQLYVERNRVAEAVLIVDPDHEESRGWLGYRRDKDGSWKRGGFPVAVDAKKEALPEWERRREELVAPFRMLAKTRLPPTRDPKLAGLLDSAARAMGVLAPDDAALREGAGETYVGGKWILKESAATAAGRRRIAEAARNARQSTAKEKLVWSTNPQWLSVLDVGGVTLRSAFPKSATEAVGLAVLRAKSLFARTFDVEAGLTDGFAVHLFVDYWSHKKFIEARKDVSEEDKKRNLDMAAYWVSDNEIVSREDTQEERVDGVVRLVLGDFKSALGRLGSASDWMREGIGMYLTHALVGTRLTVLTQDTEYSDDSVGREISDAKSDWVALARRMVDKGFDPKIPILVGTPLNSLTRDDGLFAYALAAYFLESRPADARDLVRRTQDGTNFHVALAETCRMDAEGLAYRFVRWLRETR